MSRASRRAARRAREDRRARARDRISARRARIEAGELTGSRAVTRKDRDALYTVAGRKQRYKHLARRRDQWAARRRATLSAMLATIDASVPATAAARPVSVEFAGSSVPYLAHGLARLADGTQRRWGFRFRFDRAFLEVGDSEFDDACIDEAVLLAWRDHVTGDGYAGYLADAEAGALLSELFTGLAAPAPAPAPAPGVRFGERLARTVDLLSGDGDPSLPHLLR